MHSEIILVRHFETVSNERGLFGDGEFDTIPSKLGGRQLGATHDYFHRLNLDFLEVISGSQIRQIMTARGIVGDDCSIMQDARLHEISVGEWSGKSKKDLDAQTLADWRTGKLLPPGGESRQQFKDRVLACWHELIFPRACFLVKETTTPEKPTGYLIVVTSGNPIRVIVGGVLGISDALQSQMDAQNCSITVLRVVKIGDNFQVFVKQLNGLDHLYSADVPIKMLPGTF